MKRKLVYISGQYSGPTFQSVAENILRAREYGRMAWEAGAAAFVPHMNTAFFDFDTKLSPQDFYDADLQFLSFCDAILLIPGWERSKGAKMEKLFAEGISLPIFYDVVALRGWLDEAAESSSSVRT